MEGGGQLSALPVCLCVCLSYPSLSILHPPLTHANTQTNQPTSGLDSFQVCIRMFVDELCMHPCVSAAC